MTSTQTLTLVDQASKTITVSKPYLHEIGFLRAFTTFTVVAVHSLQSVNYLAKGTTIIQLVSLLEHFLNYNRELFMFVTGLLLAYVYYRRPNFMVKQFYLKRFLLVFVPYALWTVIYTLINSFSTNILTDLSTSALNIITGNGSSQLYYIVLALQFYAIFPLFLWFLHKVASHPWLTLSISLAVQLITIWFDYSFIQTGSLSHASYAAFIVKYQDRVFPAYQFFFIFGGIAGIYLPQIRAFFQRYGRYFLGAMATVCVLYAADFYAQIYLLHQSTWQASDVLQPSVILYSGALIVFAGWVATLWIKKQPLKQLINLIAETSFGIYFIHVMILALVDYGVATLLPAGFPLPLTFLLVIGLTMSVSTLLCYFILKYPVLSWTIGKPVSIRKQRHKKSIVSIIPT